ncbi:hypothetical protein [Enterococcus sp. AZ103]|uniref:hypothetical protein n=1 Tax=Enterococcus sp. AZ103 TaxID=2774628 RepID=UPI003F2390C0
MKRKITIMFIFLFFSMIYVAPLFIRSGLVHYNNQDAYFHLARIDGLATVWKSPINFISFHQIGSDVNQFYPWLLIYPAYIFKVITGSTILGYKLYILLVTFFTMLIAYYSMKSIKNNGKTALIFSLIYTFSSYRSTDLFYRGSLGEFLAMTFLPLVLAGAYQVYYGDEKRWKLLMIGMSLLVYSHVLSVFMVGILLFLFAIFSFYFWDKKISRLLGIAKAALGTGLLSLGFVIPMLQQNAWQEIYSPTTNLINGINLSELLKNTMLNNINGYSIGAVLFFGILITLYNYKKLTKVDLVIYISGIILFLFVSNLFPWHFISTTLLVRIQFAWRLSAFATLFLAYGLSVGLTPNKKIELPFFISLIVLVVGLNTFSVYNIYKSPSVYNLAAEASDERVILTDEISGIWKNQMFFDYVSVAAQENSSLVIPYAFVLNKEQIHPEVKNHGDYVTISYDNQEGAGQLETPFLKYLGQQATLNGKKVATEISSFGTTGLAIVKGQNEITIQYHYTNVAIFSAFISFMTLIGFISWEIFLIYQRKKDDGH